MAIIRNAAMSVVAGLALMGCSSDSEDAVVDEAALEEQMAEAARDAVKDTDDMTREEVRAARAEAEETAREEAKALAEERAEAKRIADEEAAEARAEAEARQAEVAAEKDEAERRAIIGARDLDIAGIRIGDDPDTVEAALRKAGYAPHSIYGENGRNLGDSFIQQVEETANKVDPNYEATTVEEMFFEKGDESVRVNFLPFPDGPKAIIITYTNMTDKVELADILPAALGKYGEPDITDRENLKVWSNSSETDPDCESRDYVINCVTLTTRRRAVTLALQGSAKEVVELQELIQAKAKDLIGPVDTTF